MEQAQLSRENLECPQIPKSRVSIKDHLEERITQTWYRLRLPHDDGGRVGSKTPPNSHKKTNSWSESYIPSKEGSVKNLALVASPLPYLLPPPFFFLLTSVEFNKGVRDEEKWQEEK